MINIENHPHGRETYVVEYGDYVIKRPLPQLGDAARRQWLEKQTRTKHTVDEIRAVGNPTYHIPDMHFVHSSEYQVLEEYAPGVPLTRDVFDSLTQRQKYEIATSLAGFVLDMNELREVVPVRHNISEEIKYARLGNFINGKMEHWFTPREVTYMQHIYYEIGAFEYDTCMAWSHCDLNHGNVLYDAQNSRMWVIDFAEAGYHYLYRDIFSPLAIELDICNQVYEMYAKMHNAQLFELPANQRMVREILKYRTILAQLRRFIKASDDLRMNPQTDKGRENNVNKVAFVRDLIASMIRIESRYGK